MTSDTVNPFHFNLCLILSPDQDLDLLTLGWEFRTIMEFKALHIPVLTEEVAAKLEAGLRCLPGIKQLAISLETQELDLVFDEEQVGFQTLAQELEKAGCPLRGISAALFL